MRSKFIRHERSMDVCYEIIGGDEFDVLLRTWNMGQSQAFMIGVEVPMPRNKLLDNAWFVCDNVYEILNSGKSLKEGSWSPLNK